MAAARRITPCRGFTIALIFALVLVAAGGLPFAGKASGTDHSTAPASPEAATAITFRWLEPGKYQLQVVNTSGIGFINSFSWAPPAGMTVTAVTSSEAGKCHLADGQISCTTKLAPPACTCEAGGSMTVNFTATGLAPTFANGYMTYYGVMGSVLLIKKMTPVPYHIPSFISGSNT